MSREQQMRGAVAEVTAAGLCRHPVRLWGRRLDPSTGELQDGSVLTACKDRRQILCPACADRYQADAFHLVAAGLRGGKGVPVSVAGHPACFVTLTAPSFGPVHSRPSTETKDAPCRPRRRRVFCPHGAELACPVHHRPDDLRLGRPLCPSCFDYEGAVLWNASVSLLWQRTSVAIRRAVAVARGVSVRTQLRAFRLSYVKVVEFQRRGLVHLHVVVRADGPEGPGDPPPPWLDGAVLARGIEHAVGRAVVPGPETGTRASCRVRWGDERTVRVLGGADHDAVGSYLAKYAVKAATEDPVLARRLDERPGSVLAHADPHASALVRTAWRLGHRRRLRSLRLRRHAHTFGYGGHFATKSRLWSTTFGALRGARATHARETGTEGGPIFLDGSWRYAGRGYSSPDAERLAEVLAEAIATRPRAVPNQSPQGSPGAPRGR